MIGALLCAAAAAAEPTSLAFDSGRQRIEISLEGGLPSAWLACGGDCAGDGPRNRLLGAGPEGGRLEFVVPGDPVATRELAALAYEARVERAGEGRRAILGSRSEFRGRRLEHRYEFDPAGRVLRAELELPAGARLRLVGGAGLVPEELPGLGGFYSDARAVAVGDGGQQRLTDEAPGVVTAQALPAGDWAGVRGRFWALLLRGDAELALEAAEEVADRPTVDVAGGNGRLRLEFYGGPVARAALRDADPRLAGMLYAVLWEPLRWLSLGLQLLLDFWQDLVGRAWLAILLLSLSVKLLMAPLIRVAERWQADVNRTRSLLEPELAAIRREARGEEAHRRTLEVYRKHGVSHFYTFRSLAGFLIQIPVFIAAFDMLGENFQLAGESFAWAADLAMPDRAAALPLVLPFLGGDLNLLPFVMTAFTLVAARLQEDAALSPAMQQGERRKLYAMAGLFLVLLYTFPAGMVLYWTANNFWHLLRVSFDRVAGRKAAA